MEAAAGGRGFSGIMVNEEGFAIENVILARFKTPTEIQGIGIDIWLSETGSLGTVGPGNWD